MKRYSTLFVVLLLSLSLALGACGSIPTSGSQTINILIGDFYVHSPQTTFYAGVHYHFVVTNEGKHHHDFLIMHPMNTETMIMDDVYTHALTYIYNIAPGQTKTLDFTFDHTAPSGMLEFSCHYGGHYEAGMHQAIVVNAPPGKTVSAYSNNAIPANATTSSTPAGAANGACDQPVSVTIESGDMYNQSSVSLKKGDTLTIVNQTQDSFTLTTQPNAGIRFTTVDPGETEHVPFPNAGTFTLSSQEHPNTKLTVQVSSTAGVTCGMTPVATVSFDANYTNPSASQYFFIPTSVTITEGQSITLSNLADYDLTFTATPDADLGNIQLDRNEHQDLFFADNGTYTITCKQFPNQKLTVIVQDS